MNLNKALFLGEYGRVEAYSYDSPPLTTDGQALKVRSYWGSDLLYFFAVPIGMSMVLSNWVITPI